MKIKTIKFKSGFKSSRWATARQPTSPVASALKATFAFGGK